tara:strand:- start:920 stop:2563 length:1644 start_codon:yes stop_codon:yes gene_type:complete
MLFGEYFEKNKITDFENYIEYNQLKELIIDIINSKEDANINFIKVLEKQWNDYYKFIKNYNLQFNILTLEEILKFNDYVFLNSESLRKIIKKHDKNSNIKLFPTWEWKIKYNPIEKIYSLIKDLTLSNDYNKIKEETFKEKNINEEGKGGSFKRKSIKYWVKHENIIPLITTITKNLPIYSWDPEQVNIYQHISSVYLDNQKLDSYHQRIRKEQNARLIRLRWYNDDKKNIFVERKIHKEKWTLEKSSKDRFLLSDYKVLPYLRGEFYDKIEGKKELIEEISQFINEKKIYPQVRTQYKRIAFQYGKNNRIRMSLDTELKFIKEYTSHLEWFTDEDNIKESNIYRFPYAILEVKLAREEDENINWVNQIMNSDLVISQPLFSKYLTAIYHFSKDKCKVIPEWMDKIENNYQISIIIKEEEEEEKKEELSSKNCCSLIKRKENKIIKQTQVKIEPKTFFANERTYLQWFNSSIFVASAGLTINTFDPNRIIGYILIVLGGLIIFYAGIIYHFRNKALKNRQNYNYSDSIGPYFLSIGVIASFIISFFN